MGGITFGTSGWRGIIAEDFTFGGVRAVSRAIGEYVAAQESGAKTRGVVVGYDTRFLSEAFAAEAARTLAAQGIRAFLTDRDTPTPVIAYEIIRRQAAGGIIITASHNPPEYNGVKFSAAWGGPALPAATKEIETRANAILAEVEGVGAPGTSLPDVEASRLVERIEPREAYLTRLRALVDLPTLHRARLKVVVDPLFGTGRGYLDRLLQEAGCEVILLHDWRDPYFGGRSPEPSAEGLRELASRVVATGAHLGLAVDGDADRFGLVDADGSFLEPNYFLGLLLSHLVKARGWTGGVARSVATSHLVDAVARHLRIPVFETPVGFKYIGELIAQDKVVLGGEESAGLSVKSHVPEKDGILACLLMAELVAYEGKSLGKVLKDLQKRAGGIVSDRINLRVTPERKEQLLAKFAEGLAGFGGQNVTGVVTKDGYKFLLDDGCWVMFRASGTEPVFRCYLEARTARQMACFRKAAMELVG